MKITEQHIKEIKELREQKKSLRFISDVFGVSYERIRQIVREKEKAYCSYHNKNFARKCRLCVVETKYLKKLSNISSDLMSEIKRLSKQDRDEELVTERMILVFQLKYTFNLSVNNIAKLLGRHHSTIINLLKKYDKYRFGK